MSPLVKLFVHGHNIYISMHHPSHFTHLKAHLSVSKACIDLCKFQAVWMFKCKTVSICLQNGPLKVQFNSRKRKSFRILNSNVFTLLLLCFINAFSMEGNFVFAGNFV